MMSNPNALKDLVGTKVNSWTFVSYHSQGHWNVVCVCGKTAVKRTGTLTREFGAIKSCGCQTRISRAEKYLGLKFGMITVVSLDLDESKQTKFICKCDCGITKSIQLANLTSGRTKSCGCSKRSREDGTYFDNGYKYLRLLDHPDANPRGYILEHRVVMEQQIGRRLLKHENVHHKNGVRSDNRPENLELWSVSQPSGQRVVDKVEWARYILETYEGADGETLLDW